MQLTEFDFPFDPSLIADHPIHPRDQARLLLVPRGSGPYTHHQVKDLPSLLNPGDVLVVNDTKVIPARLWGHKVPGGGKLELLVVKQQDGDSWEVLIKGQVKRGQVIILGQHAQAVVVERSRERTMVRFTSDCPVHELIQKLGEVPLPPYIKRNPTLADQADYQTVFARVEGAVAAPTAGLHFTPQLLEALDARGIHNASVTLHVGPGTFRPVTVMNIHDHHMDSEWFQVPGETAKIVNKVKAEGRRVVAVGTTAVRSLEAAADEEGRVHPQTGETRLFITPGYKFRVVDALLTNFHWPRTTLIMLIAAFAGLDQARGAYEEAIKTAYRLYSYGDAMLIR